ncbi:MAG TPA: HAMP domain-containing sensor histidine kinase, partial [Steroidobacteraceae bacterium]|nr:HAMP domain-containing sensor histidine kinase [Steroidobacteraceae bacterium]
MSTSPIDPRLAIEVDIEELRRRLEMAEEMHRAIVDNELDGFVVGREEEERRVLLVGDAHLPFLLDAESERARRRALEEADRHKNEFMAVLGHELRNPLASLVNGLEILRRSGGLEPHARRAIEVMGRQVASLIRLADDLLDVNRLEKGIISLDRRRTDLVRVLADAVESARPALESKRHGLEVVAGPEPVWTNGDPVRLTQVVLNLLLNAARYTDSEGHIRLVLERLRRSDTESVAVVRVIDTGIGIEPEQIERVFEPFAQIGPRGSGRAG